MLVSVLRGPIGLVAAWNLYALIGLLGTGMAVFWLLRRLGCTTIAALFGGYVVAFSPYALERLYAGHLGLMQNWVFVLVIAAVLAPARPPVVRERQRRRRHDRAGLLRLGLPGAPRRRDRDLTFLLVELWRLPERPDRIRSLALTSFTYLSRGRHAPPTRFRLPRESARLWRSSPSHTVERPLLLRGRGCPPTSCLRPATRSRTSRGASIREI